MKQVPTLHQIEIFSRAKKGERFVIVSKDVNDNFKFVEVLGKVYQSSNKYEAEAICLAKQESSPDALFFAEVNTYLDSPVSIFLQNIFETRVKVDVADAFRWHQREGFDYCIIEVDGREIVIDSMTGLPLYMTKEKALEWQAKGYKAVKVSRYLANGKPIITEFLGG